MPPRPTRAFYARKALAVAPDLLGWRLIHDLGRGERIEGTIVEVEAYCGDGHDPSAHSHNGRTERNATMFGPPGRLYVYRSMGIHCCANVACEPAGAGAAVLLRAVETTRGEAHASRRRAGRTGRELANGPGKLCQAFGISLAHDGVDVLRGPLRLAPPASGCAPPVVMAGPRIGISKAVDLPYRFFVAGSDCVTRSPKNREAKVFCADP